MKLPEKKRGPLPVSFGDSVEADYYEACNGLIVISRPLLRRRKDGRRNAPYEWYERKSGPWQCVMKASGLSIQLSASKRIVFTSVQRAIAYAEAVVPLLIFLGVDPTSPKPVPEDYKPAHAREVLWQLYVTIELNGAK